MFAQRLRCGSSSGVAQYPQRSDAVRLLGSSFSSPLEREKRAGTYGCAGCGAPLFASATKFDSGTGWPSFFEAKAGAVEQTLQPLYCIGDFGARECRCARCGCHLGHVFTDGPKPTGLRYCMNGVALSFSPDA